MLNGGNQCFGRKVAAVLEVYLFFVFDFAETQPVQKESEF